MKRFSLFILVLIFSGCSTTWHINKARDKCPECFNLDTTINEVVFKLDTIIKIDTNIIINFNTDTVYKDTSIKKLKPYSFKPIKVENGIINAEVSMYRGTLSVATWLDSSMIYHYEDEILIRDALITKLRTVNTEQTVIIEDQTNELKWYQKWLNIGKYVLICIGGLLVVGIIYKIYKMFFK